VPDCATCPLAEWLRQKRANAEATRELAGQDIEALDLSPEPADEAGRAHRKALRTELGIALGRASTTADVCAAALAHRPKPD
jgi:hypothetical protein